MFFFMNIMFTTIRGWCLRTEHYVSLITKAAMNLL